MEQEVINGNSDSKFMEMRYDAIIVGSGIGGLNCACILALNGNKVLVLERNGFIGGRCAGYKKNGYTIDYGVHAFSLGEFGPLHYPMLQAKRKSGMKNLIKWNRLNPVIKYKDSYIRSYLPMNVSHFWNLFRTTASYLTFKASPEDKKTFIKLTGMMKGMKKADLESLGSLTVKQFIDKYTDSRFVHCMMAISSDSYSVVPYTLVAAQDFVEVYKNAITGKGVGYPNGGCAAIPNAYNKIISSHGGIIKTYEPVDKVIIDGSKGAIGVKLKNHPREIFADKIITNVNWKHVMGPLIDRSFFPSELANKIDSLKHSYSSVVAHVALDKKIIKERFVMKSATLKPEEIFERRAKGEWVKDVGCFMPIVSNIDPNLAPPGKQLALAGAGTSYEYSNEKDKFVELILDELQELVVKGENIRDHIEFMDVSGPQDLEALFGEKGCIVGCAQMIGQVREHRLDSKTPIKNLFHCGDDSGRGLFGVGTELAALSGQKCADLVLKDFMNNSMKER